MEPNPIQRTPIQRVLLVEDNPGDARLLQLFLAQAGEGAFALECVSRLAEGLARAARGDLALALLDLTLPDSDGMDTFLKMHARAPDLPIIVLSGTANETIALQAVQEGAQDYLVKGRSDAAGVVRAMRYAIERAEIAAERAHYAEELRRRNAELEADLNMAREIQRAMLPQQFPLFPPDAPPGRSVLRFAHLYLPAAAVGGDFFTVLPLGDRSAGVFICDVTGHGLRAALVTAVLRGLMEQLRPQALDPGQFLAEMNRSLHSILRRTGETMLATAVYLVADAARREWRWANAGHPSPLLVPRRGGTVETLKARDPRHGPVLGLFSKAAFPTCRCAMGLGEAVMLFTDGLSEVSDAQGREFGLARMVAAAQERIALPTERLLEELLAEARRFAGQEPFRDDVCVVTVESAGAGGTRT